MGGERKFASVDKRRAHGPAKPEVKHCETKWVARSSSPSSAADAAADESEVKRLRQRRQQRRARTVFGQKCTERTILGRTMEHRTEMPSSATMRPRYSADDGRETWTEGRRRSGHSAGQATQGQAGGEPLKALAALLCM